MEHYKTVIGTKLLNEYIKLGWKRVHVFTKPTEWDDAGSPVDYEAAFVVVWDFPGESAVPKKPGAWLSSPVADPEPIGPADATK